MTELNDELLVAYVDGQLAKDQSKAIERVLEEDEVAAQRVAALRAANTHLETAFEAMIAGEPIPVPAADLEAAAQGRLRRTISALRRLSAFAWVGSGCLLAGAAAGFIYSDHIAADPFKEAGDSAAARTIAAPAPSMALPAAAPVTWAGDMVRAHSLLSPETFSFGLESEGNMELTGFQISKTLGVDMQVPDLSANKLIFQRAQMMQREGEAFAQIAYIDESGSPVALYATRRNGEPGQLALDDLDGITFAAWAQGELSLLLAGNLPEARLREVAASIDAQLAAGVPSVQDTGAPVVRPSDDAALQPADAAAPGDTLAGAAR